MGAKKDCYGLQAAFELLALLVGQGRSRLWWMRVLGNCKEPCQGGGFLRCRFLLLHPSPLDCCAPAHPQSISQHNGACQVPLGRLPPLAKLSANPIIASPTPPRGEWRAKLLFCFAVCYRLVLEQLAVQGERPSPRGYHTLTTLGPHCVVIGGRTEEGRIQGRQMVAVFDPAAW